MLSKRLNAGGASPSRCVELEATVIAHVHTVGLHAALTARLARATDAPQARTAAAAGLHELNQTLDLHTGRRIVSRIIGAPAPALPEAVALQLASHHRDARRALARAVRLARILPVAHLVERELGRLRTELAALATELEREAAQPKAAAAHLMPLRRQ